MEEEDITGHRLPDELHSENTSEKTNMDDNRSDAIISERQVVNVQRMQWKITNNDGTTQLVPKQMIIVEFLGNEVSQNIIINLCNFSVDPYIHPVVQCYKCLRYGHSSKQCKS
ncbi:unnamed protein product [Diabrotica balteata]|uniref:CCHC-type domain-containing protein n=1 Tax=Diabrotica balteata TaxID=107213 RepID=A0A9N9XBX1_DIABA|nr:unnamed protein product [Diabrotica balteata]